MSTLARNVREHYRFMRSLGFTHAEARRSARRVIRKYIRLMVAG